MRLLDLGTAFGAAALVLLPASRAWADPIAPGLPGWQQPAAPGQAQGSSSAGPTAMKAYSPTLVVVGLVLVVGGLGVGTGGAIFLSSNDNWETNSKTPSVAALAVGGGAVLLGVPLLLIGAHSVPANPEEAKVGPWLAVSAGRVTGGYRF